MVRDPPSDLADLEAAWDAPRAALRGGWIVGRPSHHSDKRRRVPIWGRVPRSGLVQGSTLLSGGATLAPRRWEAQVTRFRDTVTCSAPGPRASRRAGPRIRLAVAAAL